MKPEDSTYIKTVRNSNLELYRIIMMLLIVAHHYVVNSGLLQAIQESDNLLNSNVMLVFGAWGKTAINCFVLITGYFMCKSKFTLHKLLKLYLQIVFYTIIIFCIFCVTGHEKFSFIKFVWNLWPIHSISDGFTSCFILFYLFIPVLNVFVNSMNREIHKYLIFLLVFAFSIMPTIPKISMTFNYVSWFMALYMIASYIRLYGIFNQISHKQWGILSILSILLGASSIVGLNWAFRNDYMNSYAVYFFISDSNKFISLAIAICSFMYFKDLQIRQSRLINAVGGTTFGILLIHANSDAMRTWLWKETVDCTGHFSESLLPTLGYAIVSVIIIFTICSCIDWVRGKFIEPLLLNRSYKLIDNLHNKLSYRFA